MKKTIWYLTVLSVFICLNNIAAATITINATRYNLIIDNNVVQTTVVCDPSDATSLTAGDYKRNSSTSNDAEILCDFDLSTISSAVINQVDFSYYFDGYESGINDMVVEIYNNSREWSGTPEYDHFGGEKWGDLPGEDILISETVTNTDTPGERNFINNPKFKSLIENWLIDPSTNKGIILTAYNATSQELIKIKGVKITIDYTPNDPPQAQNVGISGNLIAKKDITGTYTFVDGDTPPDEEGNSEFQWYRCGARVDNYIPIGGATSQTYTLTSDDINKYIVFEVTPIAETGVIRGATVTSDPVGPISDGSSNSGGSRDPDFIKTTVLTDGTDDQKPVIAKAFSEGLGKQVQAQLKLNNNGDNYLVTGTYYDGAGRDFLSVLPFVHETKSNYLSMKDYSFISGTNNYANNYYDGDPGPDAQDVPYSEIKYNEDPLARAKKTGAPGRPFSIKYEGIGGHPVSAWYLGVNKIHEDYIARAYVSEAKLYHEYAAEGIYHAVLTVINSNGETDEDRVIITITASHITIDESSAFLSAKIDATPAPPLTVVFDGTGSIANTGRIIGYKWEFGDGAVSEPYMVDISFKGGFIDKNDLTIENLDLIVNHYQFDETTPDDPTHTQVSILSNNFYLKVTHGPNDGVFTQELTDKFGNTIKTWADPDPSKTTDDIISENKYDISGKVIEEKPPEPGVPSTTYNYNKLQQLTDKITPDAGTVKSKYDKAGRIKYHETERQRAANTGDRDPFFVYAYDSFGRIITTALIDHADAPEFDDLTWDTDLTDHNSADLTVCNTGDCYYYVKVRTIYDNPADALVYIGSPGVTNQTLISLFSSGTLKNTKSRVVATISYCETCEGIPEKDCQDKIIEVFSYDQEGRVDKRYKYIPDLPLHTSTYTYDLQGKVKTEIVSNGTKTYAKTFKYNEQQQLVEIKIGTKIFATYQYNDLGQLVKKTFGEGTKTQDIDYTYNIRGWAKSIDADGNIFVENLKYEDAATNPQYNGNIAEATINQATTAHTTLNIGYTYDNTSRLTKAHNDITGSTTDADDEFDASFEYDRSGRILEKYEGYIPDPQNPGDFIPKPTTGTYNYIPTTNKLEYLAGSSTKDQVDDGSGGDSPNFIYDQNGNMILDRSKKMTVQYDWRDMPVVFSFYKEVPKTVKTISQVEALGSTNRLSRVEMIYDNSGNRVLKRVVKD